MRPVKFFRSTKGVSLPLAIGLVMLLMAGSASVNQLIIRTLRSVHQIEASNRAYMVAEAGIEDALYTLASHFAGFQTAGMTDLAAAGAVKWKNNWQIRSRDLSTCDTDEWLCGTLDRRRKLALSLFQDDGTGAQTLNVDNFSIDFHLPDALSSHPAFSNGLLIDNDDDWGGDITRVNEDAKGDTGICPGGTGGSPLATNDADCDGRTDEDGADDPVIYWKITDNAGRTLTPKSGCLTDGAGSQVCEKDFNAATLLVTLVGTAMGIREDGADQNINAFLNLIHTTQAAGQRPEIEFLVVAPMEQVHETNFIKVPIPYFQYRIPDTVTGGDQIPEPYFVLESDGYYRDFKQSITTTVTPATTVPLLDFTIIQQQ